jgi:hypothetical protein
MNMTSICNNATERNKPIMQDWGFMFLVDSEIEALRISYAYRNNKNGVKVKHCPNVEKFSVTVFNDLGKKLGFDK